MRRQGRELCDDRGLMGILRTNKDAVPHPSSGLRGFDQYHHLTAVKISCESPEHPSGKEAGVVIEGLKDPLVVEGLHKEIQ